MRSRYIDRRGLTLPWVAKLNAQLGEELRLKKICAICGQKFNGQRKPSPQHPDSCEECIKSL